MNWRSNKKFSLHSYKQMLTFKKNGLTVKKKTKKKLKPEHTKIKKKFKKILKRNLCERS